MENEKSKIILSIDVGIKNLSYCVLEAFPSHTNIIDWDNICVTNENCKKIKIEELTELIIQSLTEKFNDSFFADIVLIENQPSLKNGMMKTVAVVIFTYFNILKCQYGNINHVKFISATNKLKCHKVQTISTTKASTYKERKKLSIQIASLYIEHLCPERLDWFLNHNKKDDYADSLNQAIYYIESVLKFQI